VNLCLEVVEVIVFLVDGCAVTVPLIAITVMEQNDIGGGRKFN